MAHLYIQEFLLDLGVSNLWRKMQNKGGKELIQGTERSAYTAMS